jgi:tRNA 5-methylaminomethyl-2-thiouridine biosynthesis bifunctional protein
VIYDGYITPPLNGTHQVGASFEEWNENPETEPLQNQRLYEQLIRHVPPLSHEPNGAERARQYLARVAFRTASTDRFPIIGPVPDRAAWIAAARNGGRAKQAGDFRANLPGLYVHTALGSRGLVFAPLGAEILAALIAGEIPPVESDLLAALDAGRFLRRAWRRGELIE